jgi:endo-1,3-1,4-beta-glycanase ExoK
MRFFQVFLFSGGCMLSCSNGSASRSETGGLSSDVPAPSIGSASATISASALTDSGSTAQPGETFTLLYRDDFDSLDLSRWQIMTHSWDSNLALFSSQAVTVTDGQLQLQLKPAPDGTTDDTGAVKTYFGAEVRSKATLTYGRVRARAKLATGSAVVSSLVTIYTPWPADNWNELDIECLGQDPSQVQFNTMVYTGEAPAKPVTTSVTPTQTPYLTALGFDASADYHIYTIEWSPAGATFAVDEQVLYTWSEDIALMTLPQNVLMTIWASSAADWAGPVTEQTANASVTYDWIELYRYTP